MTAAAQDPDVIEIFNFGWYKEEDDGRYTRHSGHWVNVVGVGSEPRHFDVHNPLLKPETQETNTDIILNLIDENFVVTDANGNKSNRTGCYQAEGVGLPFNKNKYSAAILDSVIVFKLKKE